MNKSYCKIESGLITCVGLILPSSITELNHFTETRTTEGIKDKNNGKQKIPTDTSGQLQVYVTKSYAGVNEGICCVLLLYGC